MPEQHQCIRDVLLHPMQVGAPVKPPRAPSVLKAAMPVARAFPNRNVAGQLQIGPSRVHIYFSCDK